MRACQRIQTAIRTVWRAGDPALPGELCALATAARAPRGAAQRAGLGTLDRTLEAGAAAATSRWRPAAAAGGSCHPFAKAEEAPWARGTCGVDSSPRAAAVRHVGAGEPQAHAHFTCALATHQTAALPIACLASPPFNPPPPPPPPPSLPVPLPLGTAAGFFKSQGRPQLQARQGRPVAAGALACRGRAGPADPPRVPATWPAAAAAAGLIALCDPWLLPDILASLLAPRGYCLPCVATAFPRGYCLPSWLLPSLRAACQVWMLNIPGNGNPFAIFPGRPPAADLCSLLCPAPPLPPSARSAARATSGAASQAPYNASIGMLQRIGM